MRKIKFIAFILLVAACQVKERVDEHTGDSLISIRLNKKQIREAKIVTDSIRQRLFPQIYQCRGYFYLSPDKLATVTSPISGFIRNMYYSTGDYVQKGTLLAILTHLDYIKIQREYVEAKSLANYYIEDFKRQGDLTLDHATSIKKMQRAQADYRAIEAKLRALRAQLKFIGLDADKVEKDGFTSSINIYAPISGYITRVEGNIGKLVDSYGFIYEIADINKLLLSFELPGRLFYKVSKNMTVSFTVSGKNINHLNAGICNIGQVINTETNSFNVYAIPDSNDRSFRPGMPVEMLLTLEDIKVPSLPDKAIIESDNKSYIFVKEKNIFTRTCINTGNSKDNFIEISNIPENFGNSEIVIFGARYLNMQIDKY